MRKIDTFVTLTLVVLDSASGRALCLCAGGEPPLVLRASGVIDEVDIRRPALSLLKTDIAIHGRTKCGRFGVRWVEGRVG